MHFHFDLGSDLDSDLGHLASVLLNNYMLGLLDAAECSLVLYTPYV